MAKIPARNRFDATLVRTIIAQQARRSERLLAADDVLVNEGPLDQLRPRVEWLHRSYCEYARGSADRL